MTTEEMGNEKRSPGQRDLGLLGKRDACWRRLLGCREIQLELPGCGWGVAECTLPDSRTISPPPQHSLALSRSQVQNKREQMMSFLLQRCKLEGQLFRAKLHCTAEPCTLCLQTWSYNQPSRGHYCMAASERGDERLFLM